MSLHALVIPPSKAARGTRGRELEWKMTRTPDTAEIPSKNMTVTQPFPNKSKSPILETRDEQTVDTPHVFFLPCVLSP